MGKNTRRYSPVVAMFSARIANSTLLDAYGKLSNCIRSSTSYRSDNDTGSASVGHCRRLFWILRGSANSTANCMAKARQQKSSIVLRNCRNDLLSSIVCDRIFDFSTVLFPVLRLERLVIKNAICTRVVDIPTIEEELAIRKSSTLLTSQVSRSSV